jgi:hypothetical protein
VVDGFKERRHTTVNQRCAMDGEGWCDETKWKMAYGCGWWKTGANMGLNCQGRTREEDAGVNQSDEDDNASDDGPVNNRNLSVRRGFRH